VSIRADSRLMGQNQRRIVDVIDYLLETAFPGVSGFKHDRRPPHRVEGGACVPLTPEQREGWHLDGTNKVAGNGPILAHCKELARMLVAALKDLEALQPQEMEGVLSVVETPVEAGEDGPGRPEKARGENGGKKENGRTENGSRKENGRSENGRAENGRQENGKKAGAR